MRPLRTIAVLPTMFTLGNLVCGFFAIVMASRVGTPQVDMLDPKQAGDLAFSAFLIFLAMIFDALDGYVARLSRSASDFGKELDSLCDVVSFGVAPAFLLVKMCPRVAMAHREAIWVIAASYAACAALRLARFNVESAENDDHMHFSGLPSPAAAAAIAGFAILFYTLRSKDEPALLYAEEIQLWVQAVLPIFALFISLLMVSRVPYPHVVNQLFRGHRSFGHVVAVLFALVAVMVIHGYAVAIVGTAFALSGPIRFAWRKVVRKRDQQKPMF